jgi:hypothetical protein
MDPSPWAYLKGPTKKSKRNYSASMLIEVDGQTWDTVSEIFNDGGVGLRCRSKTCPATALKGSGDIFKESDGKVNGSGGITAGGDMVLTTTEVVAPIIVQFPFKIM